jgi:hypothetical protein
VTNARAAWLIAIAVTIVAVITVAVVALRHHDGGGPLKPCPTEDSINCLWISWHGGTSFVDVDGTDYPLVGQP